jgi:hypothetical protein
MKHLLDEFSYLISSSIALCFSSSKRCSHCLTYLELAWISKECSVTSLRMPGMSEGLHANMSLFARRKSMSTASYLGSRVVPMHTLLLLEPLGSRGISLTPSTGLKELVGCLGSSTSLRHTSSSAARTSDSMMALVFS